MKFKIRHADKIVGILTLIAVVFLVVVIFFLGSRQRWFQNPQSYYTILESASGVSENMPVQYKGFSIGTVDSIELVNSVQTEDAPLLPENDEVKVTFHIFEEYINRVKTGSLVKVIISPIGLGNQFQFYPGIGEALVEENTLIPLIDSYEARQLMAQGITQVREGEDNLSAIFAQVSDVLGNINTVLIQASEAMAGIDAAAIERIVGGVEETITSISSAASDVDNDLSPILQEIHNAVSSLNNKLNDPDGMLSSLLESDGVMLNELENSLHSLSGTLLNIEHLTGTQASGLIQELRGTISSAEDVLESLKNNPLLKKGFTENAGVESGGNSPRDIPF